MVIEKIAALGVKHTRPKKDTHTKMMLEGDRNLEKEDVVENCKMVRTDWRRSVKLLEGDLHVQIYSPKIKLFLKVNEETHLVLPVYMFATCLDELVLFCLFFFFLLLLLSCEPVSSCAT